MGPRLINCGLLKCNHSRRDSITNITSDVVAFCQLSSVQSSTSFEIFKNFEKSEEFNNITSAIISAYLISTLKFQIEKIDKFNNITVAIFNAYLISTLKFENINHFWEIPKI